MNTIFYFSGTGNSYYVAKIISESIGGSLKPIVSVKKGDVIDTDILCFVFPIYDFKPPKVITEIIENLSQIKANYIVGIGTYGVASHSALSHFKETLSHKGVALSKGFGVKMPHNAVCSDGVTDEQNNTTIMNADKKIAVMIENIQARITGEIEKTSIWEDLSILKQLPKLMRFLFILLVKGPKALGFTVTDDCISCNQCEKICPVKNIEFTDGKPKFGKDCTGCFACMQWCPKSAIHIGQYTFEEIYIKHYHHPKVKAKDLIIFK